MQSGITASKELQDAFNNFTSTPSLFALPITITGESLTPEPAIPFTSTSSSSESFNASLPSLRDHLHPKTPIYLILRPTPQQNHDLIAVTYVPSSSPVRQKMLFASTRNTLIRDLGLEKFGDNVFVTDGTEVLDPAQWVARGKDGGTTGQLRGGGNAGASAGEDILSNEERELQGVKRAEEEERHGTSGRDLMGEGGSGGRLAMKITDDARRALSTISSSSNSNSSSGPQGGTMVQLGIEISSETLELLREDSGVQPGHFLSSIPGDRPSYSFYAYPSATDGESNGEAQVVFVYTCPGTSKVKERMVYASARASVLQAAKGEGVVVSKRLEQGDADEITEARLVEEVGVKSGAAGEGASGASSSSKQGFARPKRPGKR